MRNGGEGKLTNGTGQDGRGSLRCSSSRDLDLRACNLLCSGSEAGLPVAQMGGVM